MKQRSVIFFYALYFSSIFFIFFLAIISIPNNPISLRFNLRINKTVNALLPEGWAFFTRDCKEEQLFIYDISGSNARLLSFYTSDLNQALGFNRHNRVMHNKLGTILSNVEESAFYESDMELNKVRLDSVNEAFVSISNSKICGKYLMKLQKPISWTWYSSNMEFKNSYRMIILNLKCND